MLHLPDHLQTRPHTLSGAILPRSFYLGRDVVELSRALLGCYLVAKNDETEKTAGMIVETEAYSGTGDKACHAHQNRFTKRTKVMFDNGGVAYVYLCYGIHHLFNIVTNTEGNADAILVRAIEPVAGLETMRQRRNMDKIKPKMSNGPGKLTKALGITVDDYGYPLFAGQHIWIEEKSTPVKASSIGTGPRVGVDFAGEDAKKNWRFYVKDNPWVSPAK